MLRQNIPQMVAAARDVGLRGAPLSPRAHLKADAWLALNGLDAPHQLRRPEHAPVVQEPGREVQYFNSVAMGVKKACSQDRRARVIRLLGPGQLFNLHAHESGLIGIIRPAQQRLKYGHAVKARAAMPDNARAFINQGADGAVTDDGKLQTGNKAGI